MGIISTIIFGLVVGAIARFVLPGEQKMGWILTCLLGIGGSVVGGFVAQALGFPIGEGRAWIASIIGAVGLLFIVGKLKGSGGSSS